jgi:hypothetical protein
LTVCKGGVPCYKTYYVGVAKRDRYKQIAKKQLISGSRTPKYIGYWNETAPRLKHFKVKGFARKYLGSTFTRDFAHLSGFVWKHTNYLARFGVPSYSEVSKSKYNKDGSHTVVLKDGSKFTSRFLMSRKGRFRLITDGELKRQSNVKFRTEIGGNIKLVKDPDGVTRRVLNIDTLKGYDSEALAGFMDYAQTKFARIVGDISKMNDMQIGMLLLNGFGENVEVDNNIKQKLLSLGVYNDKVKKWINNAKNVQDIVNALVKFGVVNERDDRIQEIVRYIKSKQINKLVFNSVRNGIHNTKSQNTLHAFQLQISADNDYHKGFRRYRKLIGG